MPHTVISDIITNDEFMPYVYEAIREKNRLITSGVVINDSTMDFQTSSGGSTVTVPFYKPLTETAADAQVLSEVANITVDNVETGSQTAHIMMRAAAFGVTDLVKAVNLNRHDPMNVVAAQIAQYWAKQDQLALINILEGVFGAALLGTHSIEAKVGAGDLDASTGDNLNPNWAIDAKSLLGDDQDEFTTIMMHPTVHSNLKKAGLITQVSDSQNSGTVDASDFRGEISSDHTFETFEGMRVLVDGRMPRVAASSGGGFIYTSYISAAGTIAMGQSAAPVPFETERSALINGGQSVLVSRRHTVIHPYWTSFNAAGGSAMAGSSPTNAELANSAKWTSVATDPRNIRIVRILSNG